MKSSDRLFMGIYPAGIVYADRHIEEHGDYRKLAFLSYSTLELDFYPPIPAALLPRIKSDAAAIQARRGEQFQISTSGQTVLLGEALETQAAH